MTHLLEAVDLKRKYPKETKGFTIWQVQSIWEDYSDSMAAGWLLPSDAAEVERVFDQYRVED